MEGMLYPLFLFGPALATLLLDAEEAMGWAWCLTLVGNLAYFCLRAAGSAASAISRERELGTWEALCATRLTPAEIYLRKLTGVVRPLLVPFLCFLTLPLVYGRVGQVVSESWLPLALLTLVYTWFAASLGLYHSLTCPDSQGAGRRTFGWLAVVAIAPLVGWFGLMVADSEPDFGPAAALCPTLSYMSAYLKHESSFREASDAWWLSALLYAGLAAALTGAGLRRVAEPVRGRRSRLRGARQLSHIEDPMAYRRACTSSRLTAFLRVAVPVLAYGALAVSFRPDKAYVLWSILAVVGLSLVSIATGAGLIASERERGTLEVLLASPLKPREILWSKLRVAFLPVLWDTVLACLLTVGAGVRADLPYSVSAQNCLVLLASAAFFGALAVYCSTRFPTTLKASQRAYFALGFLALVTFWIDVPLNQFIGHNFSCLIWVNPLVAAVLPAESGNIWLQEYLPLTFSVLYLTAAVALLRRSPHHLQGA